MYVKAIREFLDFLPALDYPLKEIKFCDKSKEMDSLVQNAFEISRGTPAVLLEKSVMMQAMNIPKPKKHIPFGNSARKTSDEFKLGQQIFPNPYIPPPTSPSPKPCQSSLNGSIPDSTTLSNWVFKGCQNGTSTFMVNNLKVLIYQYDIVNLGNVDIIVSTENQQVAGNGKLAKALLLKAGKEYQEEHAKLYSQKKRNWTDVLQTRAGHLNCKVVLHAIIEQFPNKDPSKFHINMLSDTLRKVLETANKKKKANWFKDFQCVSIALPLLGAGTSFIFHLSQSLKRANLIFAFFVDIVYISIFCSICRANFNETLGYKEIQQKFNKRTKSVSLW